MEADANWADRGYRDESWLLTVGGSSWKSFGGPGSIRFFELIFRTPEGSLRLVDSDLLHELHIEVNCHIVTDQKAAGFECRVPG